MSASKYGVCLLALIPVITASVSVRTGIEDPVTICGHCNPKFPTITNSAYLSLDTSNLHKLAGTCTRHVTTHNCTEQVQGCRFWGKLVLTELDAASNANPTPIASGSSPGWVQVSDNPGHRKWEMDFGSGGAETVVACNGGDPYGLKVSHVLPDGTNPVDDVQCKCDPCKVDPQ